jgi:prepilin-type processing-associated H-X9-DG protein
VGARDTQYLAYVNDPSNGILPSGTTCPVTKLGFQTGSINDSCDQLHWWSWHPGGANWTFGDGSARFIAYTIDSPGTVTPPTTLMQLVTRNGGEVIIGDY